MHSWLKGKLEISHGENAPLLSMEGLRGVAVFLVFWVHYSSLSAPWLSGFSVKFSEFIHGFGHLGVDLFFVLSGYLIYGSIISKNSFSIAKYSSRRAHRIYPTFLVVFILYIALSIVFPGESKLPAGVLDKVIYLIQNLIFLPGIFDIEPIISVAWSLSYEVFYYILIPVVIFSLKMKYWSSNVRIAFWIIVSVFFLFIYSMIGGPVRLVMFVSGILLFEFYKIKKQTINNGGTRFLLIPLVIFGFKPIVEFIESLAILSVFLFFLLLCLCAFNRESRSYKWLTYAPLRWLGNMSYSYYLIHGLALKFSFFIIGSILPDGFTSASLYYWLWAPLFLLTVIISLALFLTIERPLSLKVGSVGNSSKS